MCKKLGSSDYEGPMMALVVLCVGVCEMDVERPPDQQIAQISISGSSEPKVDPPSVKTAEHMAQLMTPALYI